MEFSIVQGWTSGRDLWQETNGSEGTIVINMVLSRTTWVLIEIGVVTTVSLDLNDSAVVLPKCGQDTKGIVLNLELGMNEYKRSERWSRLETYPKVTVFCKVSWHITRMLPNGSVLVEVERCAHIEEAVAREVIRQE